MPRVKFGLSAFERFRGNGPQLPVVNMFAEPTPAEETGVLLQSRPGLSKYILGPGELTMGDGPVEAMFQNDGMFFGLTLAVSNGFLYRADLAAGSVLLGPAPGDGPVSIAGNDPSTVMVAAGSELTVAVGGTVSTVAFPDDQDVIKVISGASRFIAIPKNSGAFYWTEPLGTTFDGLAFATTESGPDPLLDGLFLKDGLVLFGSETVEFWPNTGDPELPFQPLEGMVFQKGIRATGCAARIGTIFAWVTENDEVCLENPDNVISNPGLEEKIAASATCALWTFTIEAQEFLALRIDAGTWAYGFRNRMWSEMQSYGEDNWIPQCFAQGVFGSSLDGSIIAFNDAHTDFDGVLERRFRFGAPLNGGAQKINNVTLRTNPGRTPVLDGQYSDPQAELRLSRDVGATWGAWRAASLGEQGSYRKRVQWRSCGLASAPGVFGEIRVTDPVSFSVAGVFVNEPNGGR